MLHFFLCLWAFSFLMTKAKACKGSGGVNNKALHSRVSFLYQAAAYLATRDLQTLEDSSNAKRMDAHQGVTRACAGALHIAFQDEASLPSQALSRRCISDLRSVTLKTQIRLSPSVKHSICKRCDLMLLDGSTCTSKVENKSKGGRKPWADVLVRKCKSCGYERRFPCEANRQARRLSRPLKAKKAGHC